ncbi:MAG: pyruvate kinase [Anaerolineae bacterium]|jgi:pyruvate kinase
MRRTKIVCTLGPVSYDAHVLRQLVQAGMDVARINFSHGSLTVHAEAIANLRRIAEEEGRLVSVMADLQGPKLRVGELPEDGVELVEGQKILLTDAPYKPGRIPVPHPQILHQIQDGQRIMLDDGRLELRCGCSDSAGVRCQVEVGGRLTSHKGLNLPGANLKISALTPKDRQDVRFAVEQRVDFIALSFVRSADDVKELCWLIRDIGASIPIISKIEKPEALEAFNEILEETDGVMVARGDLGVETPPEEVPFHQKTIIRRCNLAGKPVITATQMLQSMMRWPTPTRAEASDVVNAILDGTDAVMLSGETAVGEYPVESVRTMATICSNAEAHLEPARFLQGDDDSQACTVTESISQATVEIAADLEVRAILSATMTGTTARMVARHRPAVRIVAVTPNERTLARLTMVWGVEPLFVSHFKTTDEMVFMIVRAAYQAGVVKKGDRVVLTAGIPFGGEGLTNMIKVHIVGESGEV